MTLWMFLPRDVGRAIIIFGSITYIVNFVNKDYAMFNKTGYLAINCAINADVKA